MPTATRPVTLNTAELTWTDADGADHKIDPVTFVVRGDHAIASRNGVHLWEAIITGYDRPASRTLVVHLADGPDVKVVSYCRPCRGRH